MLFVSACSNISQVGILGNVNNSERNKACMDMTQFKVLQVVEDGHALAFECNDGDYCYNNTVVLLTPQKGIDYYDDMIVGLTSYFCILKTYGIIKSQIFKNTVTRNNRIVKHKLALKQTVANIQMIKCFGFGFIKSTHI